MMSYHWIGPACGCSTGSTDSEHGLLATLLAARGIVDPARIAAFLTPSATSLGDPFAMAGLSAAVTRIQAARRADEIVAVYGDYDVDGIASTALLVRSLSRMGFSTVLPYIPNRLVEGYGLHVAAIDRLAAAGASLVVTVDCGVTNHHEAAYARARGVDLIVLDHHQVHSSLPDAVAVLDPHRADCQYPYKDLAAVGVVYTLLRGLARNGVSLNGAWRENEPDLLDMLDLVALGTVADVVPLVGENRTLVTWGLRALRHGHRVGIRALLETAGIAPEAVRSWHIGFLLGPRLNAAGRMASPGPALQLLLTDSDREARELALELGRFNALRQRSLAGVLDQAERVLATNGPVDDSRRYLQAAGPGWSPGIVGLVAGRLTERYSRPVLILDRGETYSTGSARSIDGFNIVEALDRCADLLERYGGHAKAAGLTVANDKLQELEQRLTALAGASLRPEQLRPTIRIDVELPLDEVTASVVATIDRLEPFGHGNPRPVVLIRGARVASAGASRDGKHLLFSLQRPGHRPLRAVAFRLGDRLPELRAAARIDLAGCPTGDTWQRETRLSLRVLDFRQTS